LVFPRDHGSHNDVRTEWWYLTGHAQDAAGRLFGFQVTFFRSRVDSTQTLPGQLAARHLLFAHAAITDVQNGQLWHDQRIARWNGTWPTHPQALLRGVFASTEDTHVMLRDWSLQRLPDGRYQARIRSEHLRLDIEATPTQPLLLQGDQGFSRKGPEPQQASFYVTEPQLRVQGQLAFEASGSPPSAVFPVQGRAWLDHEWSEALMHPDTVGWDWIGMNLFNGEALTAFQLRRADGSALWTGGSWRHRTGTAANEWQTHHLPDGTLHFTPLRYWTSPKTGARYPVAWTVRVQIPATIRRTSHTQHNSAVFTVKTMVDAQELDSRSSTGTVYWEGLSTLLNESGESVGRGYLEMTGYAQRLVL
jgi:predicted secreted hydrolase